MTPLNSALHLVVQFLVRTDDPARLGAICADLSDPAFLESPTGRAWAFIAAAFEHAGNARAGTTAQFMDWVVADGPDVTRPVLDTLRNRLLPEPRGENTEDQLPWARGWLDILVRGAIPGGWPSSSHAFPVWRARGLLLPIGYAVLERAVDRRVPKISSRGDADTYLGELSELWDEYLTCPIAGSVRLTTYDELVVMLENWAQELWS